MRFVRCASPERDKRLCAGLASVLRRTCAALDGCTDRDTVTVVRTQHWNENDNVIEQHGLVDLVYTLNETTTADNWSEDRTTRRY